MTEPQATCSVEVGLLRKKPCGHAAVAECENCQQPLCTEHAVAQLTASGKRSGKFLCKECAAAQKEQEKSLAAVARSQEEKKKAAFAKAAMESVANPGAKKPVAPAPGAPAAKAGTPAAKPAEPAAQEPDALEFTPKDGNLSYTTKEKK
jgi:hypothetical protein